MSIYDILHIDESKILLPAENMNYYLKDNIESLNRAIQFINKFHSYFHFEQSFAYLLCAYCSKCLGLYNDQKEYIEKSIFQDHENEYAINFDHSDLSQIISYKKNIIFEDDFWDFAIGQHHKDDNIEELDLSMEYCIREIKKIDQITSIKIHNREFEYDKNSTHRIALLHTLRHLISDDFEEAFIHSQNMVANLEAAHKRYHEYASYIYTRRSKLFSNLGQEALAQNDLIKAKDLNPALEF